jgi:hypothetical protein
MMRGMLPWERSQIRPLSFKKISDDLPSVSKAMSVERINSVNIETRQRPVFAARVDNIISTLNEKNVNSQSALNVSLRVTSHARRP